LDFTAPELKILEFLKTPEHEKILSPQSIRGGRGFSVFFKNQNLPRFAPMDVFFFFPPRKKTGWGGVPSGVWGEFPFGKKKKKKKPPALEKNNPPFPKTKFQKSFFFFESPVWFFKNTNNLCPPGAGNPGHFVFQESPPFPPRVPRGKKKKKKKTGFFFSRGKKKGKRPPWFPPWAVWLPPGSRKTQKPPPPQPEPPRGKPPPPAPTPGFFALIPVFGPKLGKKKKPLTVPKKVPVPPPNFEKGGGWGNGPQARRQAPRFAPSPGFDKRGFPPRPAPEFLAFGVPPRKRKKNQFPGRGITRLLNWQNTPDKIFGFPKRKTKKNHPGFFFFSPESRFFWGVGNQKTPV